MTEVCNVFRSLFPQAAPHWQSCGIDWFGRLPAHGPGALEYHSYFDVAQRSYDLDLYPESKAAFRRRFGR